MLSNKIIARLVAILILTSSFILVTGCESGPEITPDPNPRPQAQAPAPNDSSSGASTGTPVIPVTYNGTARVTRTGTNCVVNATGTLVINSDSSMRVELSGPMLDNYQTCSLESSKEAWIFKGTAGSGALSFTSCNNSDEMHPEGSGTYSDKTAAVSARCAENDTGDYLAIDATFTH